jgi:uncharacterized linocin/CFP29 family protein
MNNLHRSLAPISDAAWSDIEEEAKRTFQRNIAARRVVDVSGPHGSDFSAVSLGRLQDVAAPGDGVQSRLYRVAPVVQLRVPFTLSRTEIDSVERGAKDADWEPLKEAAQRIAFAEDRAILDGYPPRVSAVSGRAPPTRWCAVPRTRSTSPRPLLGR